MKSASFILQPLLFVYTKSKFVNLIESSLIVKLLVAVKNMLSNELHFEYFYANINIAGAEKFYKFTI